MKVDGSPPSPSPTEGRRGRSVGRGFKERWIG
ncbi:Os01g0549250 [Oryza sativa Japonica Group]|nr:hypothetical protein EE612_003361 [Oryza sativa]BAH91141.1 Os01g0549250 [Oryza sativa Japonica Group]BAS72624.1 Os01g0549250 [Oryza sativa Japonica Group]|eukprot:NP_001172411.1 Os01g0549250 [Oryza sativa Japonica Group]